jgi:hypothetical protein
MAKFGCCDWVRSNLKASRFLENDQALVMDEIFADESAASRPSPQLLGTIGLGLIRSHIQYRCVVTVQGNEPRDLS